MSGSAWARLAVVTTECPHCRVSCHHDDPAQARRRRHLLRTPRPLPRPAPPPQLPGPVARRIHYRLHRRRKAHPPQSQRHHQSRRHRQAPRPAPPARHRHHPQARLHPLHRPASRPGLARPRPGRPLPQNGHKEPERTAADPGRDRRPQAPRAIGGRRPAGAGRHGSPVLHRGSEHGAPRPQARHPARRSQRPDRPQRRRPGRHPQRPARPAVQISHPGPGRRGHHRRPDPAGDGTAARPQRRAPASRAHARLHRAQPAGRDPHRRSPRPALGPRRSRRRPGHQPARPAARGRLAIRPRARGHQDRAVPPHPRPELPRVFRTGNLRLFHAASCPFRYSSRTSCGVRYPSVEWRRVLL